MLNYVQITGTFDDGQGNPLQGTATFTANTTVYAAGIPVVEANVPVTAQIIAGQLKSSTGGTLQLLATDNAGLTFAGQTGFLMWSVSIDIAGQVLPSWSFFLPHSPSTVDLFALANTAASGAGFANPMTTLGDLLYENATPAAARLAGDTSNTRKFLRTQASGGVAQAPAWDALQAADIPQLADYAPTGLSGATAASRYAGATVSGAPASGTFAVGDFAVDQSGKIWICTAAGTPGTWAQAGPTIPVSIANGGTGQATAAAALAALGGAAVAGDLGNTSASPQVTGTHLASPLPLAQGGTAAATQQAAMDGLAGAVTSGQYPRGNGTHVVMSAIQPGDLAATANEQGYAPLVLTPAGAFGWGAPWQFYADAYGAKGDGKLIGDATIAGGSLSTLTSASAGFTSADTGKHILVNDAGAGNLPLVSAITFVNSTTVTLGTAASGAVANAAAFYATDDTAAINSAVTAAETWALANGYYAEVILSAKFYGLGGAPTQTGNGSTTPTFNAQIPLPYPAANGTSQKLVIALTGAGDGSNCQYFDSTVPNLQGTCLVSMVQAPSQPDATFGWQSVIGGPSGSAGFTGHFANVKPVITGITVFTPLISKQYAFDLRYCAGMRVDKSSAQAFASVGGGIIPLPNMPGLTSFQSAGSVGLYSPVIGNNDDCYVGSFTAEGFTTGVQADDHFTALRLACIYANIGLELNSLGAASGVSHRVTIANLSCEACNAAISCNGGTMPVDISMTVEVINTADIQDNSNGILGEIRWYSLAASAPVVQGAAHARIVNDAMGPGVWSGAPAPSTGVAQQNTAWRDATVWVTSTAAITAVAVDGTSVFSGSVASGNPVPVRVPSGHTYTVTSAGGTLTTHWVLD